MKADVILDIAKKRPPQSIDPDIAGFDPASAQRLVEIPEPRPVIEHAAKQGIFIRSSALHLCTSCSSLY